MLTFLVTLGGLALFVVLMSVGLIFKGKALQGTCASQSSLLNDGTCSFCGKPAGSCENETTSEKTTTNQVNI
jgi:hypothetical protein